MRLSILILLSLACVCGKAMPAACLRILAEFSYEEAETRDPKAYSQVTEYKNGLNPNPRVVDLSERCRDACPQLRDIPILNRFGHEATEYERSILELRQGDTVMFDGKHFRLGRFLGAGNATHIFELADNPRAAIRLPFLSAANSAKGKRSDGHHFKYARYRVENFERVMDNSKQAVKITERDPAKRYVVVEKVNGSENGLSFLKGLSHDNIDLLGHDPETPIIYAWMEGPQGVRVKALISAMEANRDLLRWDFSDAPFVIEPPDFDEASGASPVRVRPIRYLIQWSGHWSVVRQYLWDETLSTGKFATA